MAKFGVRRNAILYNNSAPNHTCLRSWYYLQIDGRIDLGASLIWQCGGPYNGKYECIDADGVAYHLVDVGSYRLDTQLEVTKDDPHWAVPLKYDTLRLQATWLGLTPGIQDCLAENRYKVQAWINNQLWFHMLFTPWGVGSPSIVDVSGGSFPNSVMWQEPPSVGVYAHRGGRFRNFKCWHRP